MKDYLEPAPTWSARLRRWLRRLLFTLLAGMALGGLAAVMLPRLLPSLGARSTGARLERVRRSALYRDGAFQNLTPTQTMAPGSLWSTMKMWMFGDEQRTPPSPPPIERRSAADYASPPASGLRLTWLGHASVLVEMEGRRLLLDPIFSERCSPVSFLGPLRFHPLPLDRDALRDIDAVIISHDHYDHLDQATIVEMATLGALFIVPLGVGAHLESWGVPAAQVVELEWWQSHQIGEVTVHSTPARHYSGRFPGWTNQTLWSSWALVGRRRRIYFSGDTGYAQHFADIGGRFGPFDVAVLKIGAYGPTWPEIHMTPEEAVKAYRDLKARLLFPVHWGTFNLAYHRWNEPPERVLNAARAANARLVLPRPGQMVEMDRVPAMLDPWWR